MFHKNVICLLPDNVCSQISAGEVVQRPASVVKELLENSLDAGSKEIKLIVDDGGKTLIQVIDDGVGMSDVDARMSLEKHATSKIHTADDLYNIKTMGFRGEAIASIVSASQCEIITRCKEFKIGTKITVHGSVVMTQEPANTHVGTNFIVKNLFYNIPVRRTFLKSAEIELRHITEEFRQIALSRPDVAFVLISNKQELYNLKPTTLINRIVDIFGSFYSKRLLRCHDSNSLVTVDGFIGEPSCNKKQHYMFANGRLIKSPELHNTIVEAYDNYITKDVKICYVLFVTVATDKIDVNLQPSKTEVRFHDEDIICAFIKNVVKRALTNTNMQDIDFNSENAIHITDDFVITDTPQHSENACIDFTIGDDKEEQTSSIVSSSQSSMLFVKPSFIMSTVQSGVIIINYLRAYERIWYEEEMTNVTARAIMPQQLLFPVRVKTDVKTYNLLNDNNTLLERYGFVIVMLHSEELMITSAPTRFDEDDIKDIIGGINDDDLEQYLQQSIALRFSRKHIISANKILTSIEMQEVVNRLFSCREHIYTPSGDKIWIILDTDSVKDMIG